MGYLFFFFTFCVFVVVFMLSFYSPLSLFCSSFSYIVIELTMKSQYFVSLNISICLEANQDCDIIVHVLSETLLPKGPCDWSTGFVDQSK